MFSAVWDDYEAFFRDVGPRPSDLHTLERKDNDLGYEPGNCVWATRKDQARNRRSTRPVIWNGRTMSLAECCEVNGVDYKTTHSRLARGWTLQRAMTETLHFRGSQPKAA